MAEPIRKKVMIVDDDLTIIMTMKRYIANAGFDVVTASNGKEAIAKAQTEMPDLIVMDAVMPEMNGLQAIREIRQLEPLKKIPIIMMTGLKADEDRMSARESGATEFLKKPVKGEDLVKHILVYLKSPFGR